MFKDLVEYRTLKLQNAVTRRALDGVAQARLKALREQFEEAAHTPDAFAEGTPVPSWRRKVPRFEVQKGGTVENATGACWPVMVENCGAGGVSLSPAPDLHRGELAFLRVYEGGTLYRIPVQATWKSCSEEASSLGCTFVGLPVTER